MRKILTVLLLLGIGTAGCIDGDPPPIDPLPLTPLKVDRTYLRDDYGRYVFFHGVNLSGSTKVPDPDTGYMEKPFPLEDADRHFEIMRANGIDTIRLLVIWEAIEPDAPGVYNEDYLDYIGEIVDRARVHGIHVLMDMHQDMFSRHLMVRFNNSPKYGEPGSLESMLLALVPNSSIGEYNDSVQGDGAPRWAVEACLQEKDLDSEHWGTPRILSGLTVDGMLDLWDLFQRLLGLEDTGELPDWVVELISGYLIEPQNPFPVNETSDVLPFTLWGVSYILSLDMARCFACFLAGDKAFPDLEVGGENVKDYLQQAYAGAWAQVAERVAHQPNVIGYDIMNEPGGNFLMLTAAAGMIQAGVVDGARGALVGLLGEETGGQMYQALVDLRLLPPDTEPETLALWGLDELDVMALLDLNMGFDDKFMRPFYERVGRAILDVDQDAIIFIESSMSVDSLFGTGTGGIAGQFEEPMTHPEGLPQVVYAPHWYPDIYPMIGFNMPPRTFSASEVRYRDYQPALEEASFLAAYSLGNIPVVFGEFGTYFNFNGIEQSRDDDYLVSAHILDNYYEAFERMFASRIQWCYSPENTYEIGDGWNHEDFSILDPNEKIRGELAWSRPHARALAGKPISTHYYSKLHYFDPDKGEVDKVGEFEVVYASKETAAPTEIVIPDDLYPDGFYVWISDGHCHYDQERHVLYHMPGRDEPGVEHRLRILPPLPKNENKGWQYFFKGERVITR